jgi:hypothetical protein
LLVILSIRFHFVKVELSLPDVEDSVPYMGT